MPTLTALPVGAVLTGLAMVAVPALILIAVWAAVGALRLLLPERPLPFDSVTRRAGTGVRGARVSVRYRDLREGPAPRHTPAASGPEADPPDGGVAHPLFDDLWLRRN